MSQSFEPPLGLTHSLPPESTNLNTEPTSLGVELPKARRRAKPQSGPDVAVELPIARVVLDLPAAHLDHEYDYLVPAKWAEEAQPGTRIKARFGGQDVSGFIVERRAASDHDGELRPLRRLVSSERVLQPQIYQLAKAVAENWAGATPDVLRLAIPPRHARAEAADPAGIPPSSGAAQDSRSCELPSPWLPIWSNYLGGTDFLSAIAAGGGPRAVWLPLPGLVGTADGDPPTTPHWAAAIALAARVAASSGRGVLVIAPDATDVARICAALQVVEQTSVAVIEADTGPEARYRSFLAALRGQASVVVGTRAAVFAPVADLGLIVVWGDGEDSLDEPRAPYANARDVAVLRAEIEHCALLIGSNGRTAAAQNLARHGEFIDLRPDRAILRARAPRMRALTRAELSREGPVGAARLPSIAWQVVKSALTHRPVLFQVPRSGYIPILACADCAIRAACPSCGGPLRLSAAGVAAATSPQIDCRWCGRLLPQWKCRDCGGSSLRAVQVGAERTARELGQAFPGVPVVLSTAQAPGGVKASVSAKPALVIATPGAEPIAAGGYGAVLLLDAAQAVASLALGAPAEALRRWLAAAALAIPAQAGGQVLLIGDVPTSLANAFVTFDPVQFAERDLAERAELALPPTVRVAGLTGDRAAIEAVLGRVPLAEPDNTIGPVPVEAAEAPDGVIAEAGALFSVRQVEAPQVRVAVRVSPEDGLELAEQLRAAMRIRSARRETGTVRLQLDPADIV